MKKNAFLFAALAAVLTCSCNVEQPVDVLPDEDGEITVLAAGFAGADTKTVRQSDGKVFWSPNDEISVMRNSTSSANKKFVASNTEPAAETYFTGIMPAGTGAYWAVYPYNANNSIQNGYFVTSVPAKQEAVAGSFANNVFVSAAYEKNATKTLTFHHQCGGVKFTVTQPGIKSAVVVPADESVSLAGLVGLYAATTGSAPYIRATGSPEDMSNTVELVAPEGETLEVGEAYHIVTIPATLKGGFSLMLQKEDGTVCFRKVSKDVKIEAGHFLTLKDVDEGAEFDRYFEFSPSTIEVEPVGGLFTMNIRSTVDFHVQINDDWIKQVSVTGDPRLGATVTFSAEMNTGEERSGVMIVCDDKNCYPVVVTQGDGSKLKKVTHHSLGMRFTATWCGYCPIMSKTFHLAKDNLGDKFEYICMYATDGDYGFSDMNTLASQYKIGGYPTGIIDGRFEVENYSSEYAAGLTASAVEETETNYPAATAIGLETSLSGQNLTVKAEVFANCAETYKLTVILMENGIIGYQADYTEGNHQDFQHDRVARKTLTSSISGDSFSISEAGGTKSFTFTCTVPASYNKNNLMVLAYVQRSFGNRPVIQSGSYGDWYVDNCRVAAVGTTAPLEAE